MEAERDKRTGSEFTAGQKNTNIKRFEGFDICSLFFYPLYSVLTAFKGQISKYVQIWPILLANKPFFSAPSTVNCLIDGRWPLNFTVLCVLLLTILFFSALDPTICRLSCSVPASALEAIWRTQHATMCHTHYTHPPGTGIVHSQTPVFFIAKKGVICLLACFWSCEASC